MVVEGEPSEVGRQGGLPGGGDASRYAPRQSAARKGDTWQFPSRATLTHVLILRGPCS